MAKRKKKTRRDFMEIARANFEQIIGEKLNGEPLDKPEPPKAKAKRDPSSGRSGGVARAKKLSAKRRAEIAKKAALSRWKQVSPKKNR